jgi:hypothetical protein
MPRDLWIQFRMIKVLIFIISVSWFHAQASEMYVEAKTTFFVGLYSEVENEDFFDLSSVLNETDGVRLASGLTNVHLRLAEKMKQDKEILRSWLLLNNLGSEVEILDFPQNNYFILFKSSAENFQAILGAAASGELPKVFLDSGS